MSLVTQNETKSDTLPTIYTGIFQDKVEGIIKKSGMALGRAYSILSQFGEYFKTVEEWKTKAEAVQVKDENDKDSMKLAREGRLFLKNIRCTIENRRVELKDESKRIGEVIDGISKTLKDAIEPLEAHLKAQEEYPEIMRLRRLGERCDARMAQLAVFPWAMEGADRNIIGNLTDDMWKVYYDGLSAENERRQKEAEALERDKAIKEGRDKLRAARMLEVRSLYAFMENAAQIDLADLSEDQFLDLKAKLRSAKDADIERQRTMAEESRRNGIRARWNDRKAKRAQKALDKVREAKEAEERDRKAKEKKDRAEARRLRMAPDKDKLLAFAKQIDEIRTPELSTEDARVITDNINLLLKKVVKYTKDQANKLDQE